MELEKIDVVIDNLKKINMCLSAIVLETVLVLATVTLLLGISTSAAHNWGATGFVISLLVLALIYERLFAIIAWFIAMFPSLFIIELSETYTDVLFTVAGNLMIMLVLSHRIDALTAESNMLARMNTRA